MTQLSTAYAQTLDELYDTIADDCEPLVEPMTGPSNPQIETIQRAITRVSELFGAKNAEYAGGADVLGNFRRQAQTMHLPMSTVWNILAGKHIDAIQEYVKDSRDGLMRSRTQTITERIDDLIVYALLLQIIVEEEQTSGVIR